MGPVFSLMLIAIGSVALFMIVFFVFRVILSVTHALRLAFSFVVGAGAGAALFVGLFALAIGAGTTLATERQVVAYLATVAFGAVAGGATLSYCVARKFN